MLRSRSQPHSAASCAATLAWMRRSVYGAVRTGLLIGLLLPAGLGLAGDAVAGTALRTTPGLVAQCLALVPVVAGCVAMFRAAAGLIRTIERDASDDMPPGELAGMVNARLEVLERRLIGLAVSFFIAPCVALALLVLLPHRLG